jgi:carbonic anhydrase/acetyltransferase-like protein (isoleucine patch superfamily)
MAIIKPIKGKNPGISEGCFIAETAVIIGDVKIGKYCSIWFGAVIRGDVK